ncbi:N-alpha-acetyltransferase, 35 NatC auxiliary subunit [Termitomyces sp. T112]|nr:N-alpha-acetyltransferase, 35 NatC auxiliary subunit [Termitomyces sp. T112]KAH0584619.1 hypothetical protein H2248_010152 [Termitomyces sp. 'cryptogamus']
MDPIIVDIPEEVLPGVGFDFEDVASVFRDAAAVMEPGSFAFMDDFTLYDAMGAFEIGEPRLDSGLILENQTTPLFDPNAPLLPQELCWIMDRAFAYEMEWHFGNPLCHSVFTLLYIHALSGIDPEFVDPHALTSFGPSRPPELVYYVLRSWVMGLLKCCDLSWRELSKGCVQEMEDWQGDKCDISLLEGTPVKFVASKLQEASMWLQKATHIPVLWRNAVRARMSLRMTILQLMQVDVFSSPSDYQNLIDSAREQLMLIRSYPSPEPGTVSPALHAFDPYIARLLKTNVPLRVLSIPPSEETWKAIDRLLDGWQEACLLAQAHCLSTWEIVGNLRVWLPNPPLRIPYLRSYMQSTFYDGLMILNKFSFSWMMDHFFFETLGVSYTNIVKAIAPFCTESCASQLSTVENLLYKLIAPHIKGQWLNPPRRRRHLVNSLLNWHKVYDILSEITTSLESTLLPKTSITMHLPKVPLVWRLSAIREIIFSGFQLELLSLEERPFAYYYASQVIEDHLSCLDDLIPVVVKDSSAYQDFKFKHDLLTAIQLISVATFVSCMVTLNFDSSRMRSAFFRRYKWAFQPEYDDISTPAVGHPELYRLLPLCADIYLDDSFSPSATIGLAREILRSLVSAGFSGGWSSLWATDRLEFVKGLIGVCDRLNNLPSSVAGLDSFDVKTLKWDVQVHPWFPFVDKPVRTAP